MAVTSLLASAAWLLQSISPPNSTAHCRQLTAPLQLIGQGNQVGRFAAFVQVQHRLENHSMARHIEVIRLQERCDAQDGVRVNQERAENSLLGLGVRRRLTLDTPLAG